jgi:hypothetical protein
MESPGVDQSLSLSRVRLDLLRRAVEIYLSLAYRGSEPPMAVRRRLEWTAGADSEALLTGPPFERVGKTPSDKPIVALRLGNARYPHMKLQIQSWDCPSGYLLSVNTHDHALGVDPTAPDAEAFMALQAENQRLKVEIEQAWSDAGLPTFLAYLRSYLDQHSGGSPPPGPPGD